jgi:hypothetical protein
MDSRISMQHLAVFLGLLQSLSNTKNTKYIFVCLTLRKTATVCFKIRESLPVMAKIGRKITTSLRETVFPIGIFKGYRLLAATGCMHTTTASCLSYVSSLGYRQFHRRYRHLLYIVINKLYNIHRSWQSEVVFVSRNPGKRVTAPFILFSLFIVCYAAVGGQTTRIITTLISTRLFHSIHYVKVSRYGILFMAHRKICNAITITKHYIS